MASVSEQKSLNELSYHIVRQLRGSGGGAGGDGGLSEGRWGGSRELYGDGSSSFYFSAGEGMSTGGFIAIFVVIGVVGICYYCYVKSGNKKLDPGFEAAVKAERERGQVPPVTARAHKSSQGMQCGIGVTLQNDFVTISFIDSNGPFANSGLEVGMVVKTINCVSVMEKTAAEATKLIENAVEQVTIVAAGSRSTDLETGDNPPFETYSGTFDMSYVDQGNQCRDNVTLELRRNERTGYYDVSGTTSDADGTAYITEGFVTYGGDAWWVDEVRSGNNTGLKVLTTGKFDWLTDSFEGDWRANTGQSGCYSSFESTSVTKTPALATTATASAPAVPAVGAALVDQSHTQTPAPAVTAAEGVAA